MTSSRDICSLNGIMDKTIWLPSFFLLLPPLSESWCFFQRGVHSFSLSLTLLPLPLPPTQFLSYWQFFTHLLIHIFSLLLSFLLYFSLGKNICFQTWHSKKYIDIIAHCTEMSLYWNKVSCTTHITLVFGLIFSLFLNASCNLLNWFLTPQV